MREPALAGMQERDEDDESELETEEEEETETTDDEEDSDDVDSDADKETLAALLHSLDSASQLTNADQRALRGRRRGGGGAEPRLDNDDLKALLTETDLRNHKYALLMNIWQAANEHKKASTAVVTDLHAQARMWAEQVRFERSQHK
jgi:hypothetical protein